MLIIKGPIELKSSNFTLPIGDEFCNRITGNYEMLTTHISGEDLLHLANTPTEIFLAEGNMSQITNQMNFYTSGEAKIEIINQLMNRILLSQEASFTYQDRVYITNILRKLGITDDRQFMSQVMQLKEEIENRNQLIELYWNYAEELTSLIQEYTNQEESIHLRKEGEEQRYYLHESIMNRLDTAAIYQVVQNFVHSPRNNCWIQGDEIQLAEQGRIAQTILLQRLQSEVRGQQLPLMYRHENYYEHHLLEEENISEESIVKQMTSALLLHFIDNLYQSRYEALFSGKKSWYQLKNSFYQSGDNTLIRLKNELKYLQSDSVKEYRQHFAESQSNFYRQERNLLQQIFQESNEEEIQFLQQKNYELSVPQSSQSLVAEGILQNADKAVSEMDIHHREEVTSLRQEELSQTRQEQKLTVKEQLDKINAKTEESFRSWLEVRRQLEEGSGEKKLSDGRERTRKESLMALNDPESLMLIYQQEAKIQEQEERETSRQVLERALPETTKQIYRMVEQYLKQPEALTQVESKTMQNIQRLQQDIMQESLVHTNREKEHTREEILSEIDRKQQIKQPGVKTATDNRQYSTSSVRNVDFIHKETSHTLDEAMLEQLLENKRLVQQKNIVTQQSNQVTQTVNTQQEWRQIRNEVQQNEDVVNLIRQDMQKQIGAISEQVYSRLEKRLQNEKRRRGL